MSLCRKLEDGTLDFVNEPPFSQSIGDRSVYLHKEMLLELEKGDYLLKVKVDWYDDQPHECVLSGYASNEIVFKGDIQVDDFDKLEAISYGKKVEEP